MSLKVSNLSKLYDQKWVLRDVSFEANRGEILGLFGASASGKTTLLSALAGREKMNGGSIHIDADDVSAASVRNGGRVTALPVNDGTWKRFFGSDRSSLPAGAKQVNAISEMAGSTKNVLLLDDPFCSMDAEQKLESFNFVRRIAKEKGLVVVFATSNFGDILQFCDKVAVIADSEIRQVGTPQEVYLEPQSRAVARITGRNNLFEARRLTSSKAEVPQFQTIDGSHRLSVQKIGKSLLGALNQNVSLGIRPEHISISFGASFPEDNLIKAKITDVRFLGPTTLVALDSDGLRLDALVLRLVGLNAGDECMLGLPPDRIAVFRD